MKKEQIIRLAKEKKFVSTMLYNNPYKYSNNEDKRWLFWLTELQSWLRDNFDIDAEVSRNTQEFIDFVKERNDWNLEKYHVGIYKSGVSLKLNLSQNNDYVLCLEEVIIYALKELI